MAKKQNSYKKETTKKSSVKKEKKSNQVQEAKVKRGLGLTLGLISVYLFIAFLSYLYTWKLDQDKVDGASFFSFVFTFQDFEIYNWLGKLGAIVSHRFLNNGFGLISFLIPFYLFLLSTKLLFNIKLLPLRKSLKVSLVTLVFVSIFLGYFLEKTTFLWEVILGIVWILG